MTAYYRWSGGAEMGTKLPQGECVDDDDVDELSGRAKTSQESEHVTTWQR